MKRLTVIIFITWLTACLPLHAQWTRIDTLTYNKANTDNDRPHGITFAGKDTGYVFERHSVKTTIDSGSVWLDISPVLAQHSSIRAFSWPKAGVGYLVIHDSTAGLFRLFKTSNNGNKWDTLPFTMADTNTIEDIHFTNSDLGLIGGLRVIYKTTDGGTTWKALSVSHFTFVYINRIVMPDTNRLWIMGYMATGSSGSNRLLHSTDFGKTWDTTLAKPSTAILDLYPFTNSYLLSVTDSGSVYTSKNGGKTWNYTFSTLQINNDQTFSVPDSKHSYLFTPGYIYVSYDKGNTFKAQASPPYEGSFKGFFTDSVTGYLSATAQSSPRHWDTYKTYNGANCATLIFPTSLHVCTHSSFPLTYFTGVKRPAFKSYTWTPASTLDSSHKATPIASPTATTTYTLTINYSSMANCPPKLQDSVKVFVEPCDSVWPGDANADLTVDENDLLNIGLAYGSHGPVRSAPFLGDSFRAVPALDWSSSFAYGINYKHADCNGDGTINADDTLAIVKNFHKTHVARMAPRESNAAWPTLKMSFNTKDSASAKQHVKLTLSLYNNKTTIDSIYAMAFGLQFDPTLIDTGALALDYSTNFFTSTGNSLHIAKYFKNSGNVFTGITRTSGTNHNNDTGSVCVADIVIIDNLAGVSVLRPHLSGTGYFITASGNIQPYNIVYDTLLIKKSTGTPDLISIPGSIHLYPTVSKGTYALRYDAPTTRKIYISITDLVGHTLYQTEAVATNGLLTKTLVLPDEAAAGMYWITLTDNTRRYIIPVIKLNP